MYEHNNENGSWQLIVTLKLAIKVIHSEHLKPHTQKKTHLMISSSDGQTWTMTNKTSPRRIKKV